MKEQDRDLREQDLESREQDHRYKEQGGPVISAPRGNTHRSEAEITNLVYKKQPFFGNDWALVHRNRKRVKGL